MSGMQHGDHDHEHAHQHEEAGHEGQWGMKDTAMAHEHGATITQTDDVAGALAAGGAPVVVDVLGVVCDFCATAMNKPLVSATRSLPSTSILIRKLCLSMKARRLPTSKLKLAKKAGYRIAAIRRDSEALADESDRPKIADWFNCVVIRKHVDAIMLRYLHSITIGEQHGGLTAAVPGIMSLSVNKGPLFIAWGCC